jgi:uroporphyrinogen III methyltransferase/synthase
MSVNSVTVLIEYLEKLGLKDKFLKRMAEARIIAIGPKTERELEKHGIKVDIVPSTYTSEGIIESLRKVDLLGKTAVVLCSNRSRRYLSEELQKLGATVLKVPIYECTFPTDRSKVLAFVDALTKREIDIVMFTSSLTAINLFKIASQHVSADYLRDHLGKVIIAAIGPVTRRTLKNLGVRVDVMPKEYTIEAMVDSLVNYISKFEKEKKK